MGEQDTATKSEQEEKYAHGRADGRYYRGTWRNTLLGSRTLPPGCTELLEEHILLGEQRAATRVHEVLRESFVRRSIGAPAEDLRSLE